jgi:hypothetical protein
MSLPSVDWMSNDTTKTVKYSINKSKMQNLCTTARSTQTGTSSHIHGSLIQFGAHIHADMFNMKFCTLDATLHDMLSMNSALCTMRKAPAAPSCVVRHVSFVTVLVHMLTCALIIMISLCLIVVLYACLQRQCRKTLHHDSWAV